MKSLFFASLALVTSLAGCTTAKMDSPLVETAATWNVEGRQGRLNLERGLTFSFGPYVVRNATFGPIRTDGGLWETLLSPDTRMRQGYEFDLERDGNRIAAVGCITRASEFVDDQFAYEWPALAEYVDLTYRAGWIDCMSDSEEAPFRFLMALDEEGLYENWSGIVEADGEDWLVDSRHRYASTPVPSRDPLGHSFSDTDGRMLGDVEVINAGAVRMTSGLSRVQNDRGAAMAAILLLMPDLDDFFER